MCVDWLANWSNELLGTESFNYLLLEKPIAPKVFLITKFLLAAVVAFCGLDGFILEKME